MSRASEEKLQKQLRALVTEVPENKECFDCRQKGPVYAELTHGVFVCTTCSGIHREFSHRVKSISMATFTPQEVQFLQDHGNARARATLRAHWRAEEFAQPSPGDLEGLRRFIRMTYTDKRWAEGNVESRRDRDRVESPPARKKSTPAARDIPTPEPLSSILGPDIPKISLQAKPIHLEEMQPQRPTQQQQASLIDLLAPEPAKQPVASKPAPITPAAPVNAQQSSSVSLLASLSFDQPAPAPAASQSFANMFGAPVAAPAITQQQQTANFFDPFGAAAPSAPAPAPAPMTMPMSQSTPMMQGFMAPTPQQAWTNQMLSMLIQMGVQHPQQQQQILMNLSQMNPQQQQQYLYQLRAQMQQQQQQQLPQQQGFFSMQQQPQIQQPMFPSMNAQPQQQTRAQPDLFSAFSSAQSSKPAGPADPFPF